MSSQIFYVYYSSDLEQRGRREMFERWHRADTEWQHLGSSPCVEEDGRTKTTGQDQSQEGQQKLVLGQGRQ